MNQKIKAIERKITAIKQQLLAIDEMRPGSLSRQKRARGTLYHQLSYWHDGKAHTEYVREEMVPMVRQQLDAYRSYRELNRAWTSLAIKLCKLKAEEARAGKGE
jgi:hypothetical protein